MPAAPRSNRNRIILIVIIILCVTIVTLYVRESDKGPLHKIQNFFLDLVSPVSNAFAKIFRPIKDGVVNLFHLPSLAKERADLQKQVAELQRQRIDTKEMESNLEELKRLLNWTEQQAEIQTVGADIIGQSPNNWQRLMIINRGSASGVKKYMSVVTDQGLVGRLISVGSRTSVVELVTDSRSEIGARDQRSRETGVVAGKNDSTLRLTPMKEDADLKTGDVVETSGLGGTCPPGIPLGKITKVTNRSSGLTRYVEVKPYTDFSTLDKVLVVITPEPESVILREQQ
jgi:rod shape-determining protein MreC